MVNSQIKDGFEFVSMHYPFYQKHAIRIAVDNHKIEDYQQYIVKHALDRAEIVMPNISILEHCPTLRHLRIFPSYNSPPNYDFTPLYEHPEIISLNCLNKYGSSEQYIGEVDYSRINGLEELHVCVNKGTINYNRVPTLKSLSVGSFTGKNRDITDLFCSKELDTLTINGCKIISLNGIELSEKMQCLYLFYNRSLTDISSLSKVKDTLRTLRIENCSKIADFSVLSELENRRAARNFG